MALLAVGLVAAAVPLRADDGKPLQSLPQSSDAFPLPDKKEAGYILSLAQDGRGDIWAGTEDQGVWQFQAQTRSWKNYRVKDGLGDDNAYALAVDGQGRVWCGHLRSGVSVWNGQRWRNYPVGQGPLGERVYALAVSPVDGDVWIAHNAGLTRYVEKAQIWRHYTRTDGLVSTDVSALTFDSLGHLYVATQADGLMIGRGDNDFAQWTHVKGVERVPDVVEGAGLPSNFLNDVMVSDYDVIYAATANGLARSQDFGANWTFLRGRDWKDKLKGLYEPRAPQEWPDGFSKELLREDYVTNIAEDAQGSLLLSYRRKGFEIRRPLVDRATFSSTPEDDANNAKFAYVSAVLPLGDGTSLLGTYGDGLLHGVKQPEFTPTAEEQRNYQNRRGWRLPPAPTRVAALPLPAAAPSDEELRALTARAAAAPASERPIAAALPDDWNTQGDWLGRYGRSWANLCAMLSPRDYLWGAGGEPVAYNLRIDPRQKKNSIRYWVHWVSTDNPRVLEMPAVYFDSRVEGGYAKPKNYRRQSEVDDNGESYPLWKEGPHVYATVKVPVGRYIFSFYNHNKDGHDGSNRMRDYAISLRVHPADKALDDVRDFGKWPEVAHGRQRDLWGAVYKRYRVQGPTTLTLKLDKNQSFNVILAGLFLDRETEEPQPYFSKIQTLSIPATRSEAEHTVDRLWAAMEQARERSPVWWNAEERRYSEALLRTLEAARATTTDEGTSLLFARLGTCYYRLNMYPQWEALQERRGLTTARQIETRLEWDGAPATSGKGLAYVTANIWSHKLKALAQTPAKNGK